jgi:hypothetical protein
MNKAVWIGAPLAFFFITGVQSELNASSDAPVVSEPDPAPLRTLAQSDISWFDDTEGHKEIVTRGINMVMRDNPSCRSLTSQAGNLVPMRSTSRGSNADPVFFIGCDNGNVWFSKSEVERDAPLGEANAIDSVAAGNQCKQALNTAAKQAGVSLQGVSWFPAFETWNNGRTRATVQFESGDVAMNASCLFDGQKLIEVKICQADGFCVV